MFQYWATHTHRCKYVVAVYFLHYKLCMERWERAVWYKLPRYRCTCTCGSKKFSYEHGIDAVWDTCTCVWVQQSHWSYHEDNKGMLNGKPISSVEVWIFKFLQFLFNILIWKVCCHFSSAWFPVLKHFLLLCYSLFNFMCTLFLNIYM